MMNKEEFEKSVYSKCAAYKRRLHRNIAVCSVLCVAVLISASATFICMKSSECDSQYSYTGTNGEALAPILSASCGGSNSSYSFEQGCATDNLEEPHEQVEPPAFCDSLEGEDYNSFAQSAESCAELYLRIYSCGSTDFDEYCISNEALIEVIALLDIIGAFDNDGGRSLVKISDCENVALYYVEQKQLPQLIELLSRFGCERNNN